MTDLVLILEASTDHASVALVSNKQIVAEQSVQGRRPETGERTEGIVPAIVACLADAHRTSHELSAVVCSGGPGGFTSLRTAASIGKGICFALQIPMYAVPTLEIIVADAARADGIYVAALDAGRGEYYASVVEVRDGLVCPGKPVALLDADTLSRFVAEQRATLVGPILGRNGAPRAGAVVRLLDRVVRSGPVDIDHWEPAYGRLAEAQVKWEATHGRPLTT